MTTLEHKVRNPKKLDTWLDIWTANNITVNNDDTVNYTITPSNKWKIPITQLEGSSLPNNITVSLSQLTSGELPKDTTIPVNKIQDAAGIHNVTSSTSSYPSGVVKFDDNGSLISALPEGGDGSEFLNNKGNWASISHPENKKDTAGIVAAPNDDHNNQIWGTDNKGNPAWKGITNDDLPSDISASKISNLKSTIGPNTKTSDGLVPAVGDNINKIWASDSDGNPDWSAIEDIFPTTSNFNMIWGTDSSDDNHTPKWVSLNSVRSRLMVRYSEELKTLYIGQDSQLWDHRPKIKLYQISYSDYLQAPTKNYWYLSDDDIWRFQQLDPNLTEDQFENLGPRYDQTNTWAWDNFILNDVDITLS